MTEAQAQAAVRPHGNVRVLPSEDERPELTDAQRSAIEHLARHCDYVELDRVLPTGEVWVVAYGDGGPTHHEIDKTGLSF